MAKSTLSKRFTWVSRGESNMVTVKELAEKKELLSGGHRLCAGCGATVVVRQVLMAAKNPVVVAVATGCLEVSTTIYPYTAWNCSYIHSAFENAAATISGVESAFKALKKRGKLDGDFDFIAFGGDGGTYDIGLQSLSGVLERGHDMLYVCYDNGAYMNTGIQRSGATPLGAWTTTTPVGSVNKGKAQWRKDLTAIVAAHNVPYVAQASPSHWKDLVAKVEKALSIEGPKFINVIAPCPRGWRTEGSETIDLARGAVNSLFWPIFEIENGALRLTYKPRNPLPVRDWLARQGRFKHLFAEGNEEILEKIERKVQEDWQRLLRAEELKN